MKTSLYFLAIIPPKPIYTEVMKFKDDVSKKFDSKAALRSPPHITLHMPFKWRQDKEEVLLKKLAEFKFSECPFEIQLKNFNYFPPKVVFVDAVKNKCLDNYQKELSRFVRKELNILNADYKDKPFRPHMTIAFRDLKKVKFPDAKQHFSKMKYEACFQAKGFHLLKHDGKRWNEFRFLEIE